MSPAILTHDLVQERGNTVSQGMTRDAHEGFSQPQPSSLLSERIRKRLAR
jgi:hypothetical protein